MHRNTYAQNKLHELNMEDDKAAAAAAAAEEEKETEEEVGKTNHEHIRLIYRVGVRVCVCSWFAVVFVT